MRLLLRVQAARVLLSAFSLPYSCRINHIQKAVRHLFVKVIGHTIAKQLLRLLIRSGYPKNMKVISSTSELSIAPDLYLRQAAVSDAPALYYLINRHRTYLREWLPFIDYSKSAADTKAYLRMVTDSKNISEDVYVIMFEESVGGIIGFKGIDYINRKLEIGYWLSGDLQGKGIMQRSCRALVQYAFSEMQMNRVQIKVGVGNSKSSRIPQKLGFKLEGVQRDGEYLNGRFHDLEIYSMLQREWQQ